MKCEKCGTQLVEIETKMAFGVDEGVNMKSELCPKCDKDVFDEIQK